MSFFKKKVSQISQRARAIKIFSKKLAHSHLSGDYTSRFKGAGFNFHQLREYHQGDDTRFIDWNSYARTGQLMVKELVPERDRQIIIALDCSASMNFSSSQSINKLSQAIFISTALSAVANFSKDRCGLILFDEKIINWIPPAKGGSHFAKLEKTLGSIECGSGKTDFENLFNFISSLKLKNSLLFIVSDFIQNQITKLNQQISLIGKKFEATTIVVRDKDEIECPNFGLVDLVDPETKETFSADFSDLDLQEYVDSDIKKIERFFLRKNWNSFFISNQDDVIKKLGLYLLSSRRK